VQLPKFVIVRKVQDRYFQSVVVLVVIEGLEVIIEDTAARGQLVKNTTKGPDIRAITEAGIIRV
jgi:hypothetical protein